MAAHARRGERDAAESDVGPPAAVGQVVYLDLREHGRSERHTATGWSLELCADDVRAFCDTVGIAKPFDRVPGGGQ